MHQSFITTTRRLNRDLPPIRLYEKAKDAGPNGINRVARETEDA